MEEEKITFLFALFFGLSFLANILLIIHFYLKGLNDKKNNKPPFGQYRNRDED